MTKKGSEWRKWDLHVHAPSKYTLAKCNNYKGNSSEEKMTNFINELKTLNNVAVLGITDYFSLDGFKEIKKHEDELKNIDLILPNIELRITPFTKDGRMINIHIIANTEILDIDKIERFLHKFEFKAKQNYTCKKANLIKLGKEHNESFSNEKAFEKGLNDFSISHDTFFDSYDQEDLIFKKNTLIGVSNDQKDGVSGVKEEWETIKNFIYNGVDFIFSARPGDVDYFLAHGADNYNTIIRKYGFVKPCLRGSDYHGAKNGKVVCVPDLNRFCWIKAEPTFEGLKQVIYDPKERVKIQERSPSDSKSKRTMIDKVSYINFSGSKEEVYFNQDLNSIIGIRGSGKSTLLKNIAKGINSDQFKKIDEKDPYALNEFKIFWSDGGFDSGTTKSPKNMFYIPQAYLGGLTYDGGDLEKKRDKFLTDLLKKNSQFAHAIDQFQNFASQNELSIRDNIQKLLFKNNELLEAQALIKKQGSKDEIREETQKKEGEIKKFRKNLNIQLKDAELIEYSELCNSLEKNKTNRNFLLQDKDILALFEKEYDPEISFYNENLEKLSLNRRIRIEQIFTEEGKTRLQEIVTNELQNVEKEIEKTDTLIKKEEKRVNELKSKIDKSKALTDLTKELGELKKSLQKIEELEDQIKKNQVDQEVFLGNILNDYMSVSKKGNEFYKSIDFGSDFCFLRIDIKIKFNSQDMASFMDKNINTVTTLKEIQDDKDIEHLFSVSPKELTKIIIKKFIFGLIAGEIKIKVGAGDIFDVLSQFLKNRYYIDYLKSVKTRDGKTTFEDMTGGEKSIALLELIFEYDNEKYPILIDQPEDDLDVTGVTTNLVSFIKKEKEQRQIIIVTHSASLAICSDTENVVVSSSSKVKDGINFEYRTGGIENSERRKDIIKILEGGKEALDLRMRKLDMKQ